MNAEGDTVTTTIAKSKKADAEDKGVPKSHENIATHMVAVHTAVLNAIPKEPGTKTHHHLKNAGRQYLELILVVTMWDRFRIKIKTQFRFFGSPPY